MKTILLTGHGGESMFHSDAEQASQGEHNALLQTLAVTSFFILLCVATLAISNGMSVETHTGHFLARVTH